MNFYSLNLFYLIFNSFSQCTCMKKTETKRDRERAERSFIDTLMLKVLISFRDLERIQKNFPGGGGLRVKFLLLYPATPLDLHMK